MKIAIFYGSTNGNTADVALKIQKTFKYRYLRCG
ncbi:hypothetical protein Sdiek1_2566 [Sulfurospirillum diekertiae]|uniref:Flavodoxin-like domain-containing protein n=1 Tax=Sulfurospirillum diekertiae TaxID=1854492 RepID=A0A1Y0HQX7_9BACT|nr:hypothetical protein Sdiek1_2566 [Sulfurospirillum diekertiae]